MKTMRFLSLEPSGLPSLMPLWPKYSPRVPILNTLSLHYLLIYIHILKWDFKCFNFEFKYLNKFWKYTVGEISVKL